MIDVIDMFEHELIPEFRKFISSLPYTGEHYEDESNDEPYGYQDHPPSYDFNKEIMEPCEKWKDGLLAIRCDDNFWICAIIPYKFKDVPTMQIINELWPSIESPEILPDEVV
jgi:hypothetical protein